MHSSLADATRFLVYALAGFFGIAAVAGPMLLSFDSTRDALWVAILLGGATLMVVGQKVVKSPWPSAILVSVGAMAGGLPLFWTLVVPIAVAVVVASKIALARAGSAPA